MLQESGCRLADIVFVRGIMRPSADSIEGCRCSVPCLVIKENVLILVVNYSLFSSVRIFLRLSRSLVTDCIIPLMLYTKHKALF